VGAVECPSFSGLGQSASRRRNVRRGGGWRVRTSSRPDKRPY